MGHPCSRISTNDLIRAKATLTERPGTSQKYQKTSTTKQYAYAEATAAFIDIHAQKDLDDLSTIISALTHHFIFTSLSDEDRECVAEAMQLHIFEAGKLVFEQNRPSKSYYVLKTGLLEVEVNDRCVSKIHPGEGFGELALLQDSPRPATVRTIEKSAIWGIDRYTFRRVIEELNAHIYEVNREFLEKVNLLKPLTGQQKDSLAACLVTCKYDENDKIITEGDEGNFMYIIKEGTVSVVKAGNEIIRLFSGDIFGENSLLYNTLRTASCVAVDGPVKCVALSRDDMHKALGNRLSEIIEKNSKMEALEKSPKLSLLSKEQKENIIRDLKVKTLLVGETAIHKNSQCQSFLYIVITGKLLYSRSMELFKDKGNCVGDEYVVKSTEDKARYEDDIIAGVNMKIGKMNKYQFEISIGGKYKEMVRMNAFIHLLKQVQLFIHVDDKSIRELLAVINRKKFKHAQVVLGEQQLAEAIYIVKRGSINLIKNGVVVGTIKKHDYFGERSVLFNEGMNVACYSSGNSSVWEIPKQDFLEILNEKMKAQMLSRIRLQDERVTLQDLKVMKIIGRGTFARVYLVTTQDQQAYALKVVSKKKIQKIGVFDLMTREKQALQQLDHPFVVKLVKTFRDQRRVYFLLEYVHGYILSDILNHIGLLSNNDSVFYVASLLVTLQYLHSRDIIYRDLRPENAIVQENGYLKLIDFGTAKEVRGKTFTLIGNPFYIAPEVIVGRGYSKAADLWSLGICMYEFLCGKMPFREDKTDPFEIYECVLEMELVFPSDILSEAAMNLMKILLAKVPEHRSSGSFENLKRHSWFYGLDWDALVRTDVVAPYSPDIRPINDEMSNLRCAATLIEEDSDASLVDDIEVTDTLLIEKMSSYNQSWELDF